MKNFCFRLGLAVFCILFYTNSQAAKLLVGENFDDRSVTLPLFIEQGGPATWATGRNGSGYSIYFNLNADRDSVLMMRPGTLDSDELYVSFWMRYPDTKSTAPGSENLKYFYPHFKGGGYVGYTLMDMNTCSTYYSARDNNGNMLTTGKWIGIGSSTDGNWHHYEWYFKFSTGVHKFWYDGKLLINYTYGSGKWDNRIDYIAGPSIDAQAESYFSRQIDDYEIWDGMPSSSNTSSSTSSSNNTAPPPPGKPYIVN